MPFLSGCHDFWGEICSYSNYYYFFPVDNVSFLSGCCQNFFFVSSFLKFIYVVSWHRFLWVYLFCYFLSSLHPYVCLHLLPNLGKSGHYFSNTFPSPLSLSFLSGILLTGMLDLRSFVIISKVLRLLKIFFWSVFSLLFRLGNFGCLSQDSLTLSSFFFILLFSPYIKFFKFQLWYFLL